MNEPVRGDGPPYRVLFVCTANVCRSPMAERLLALRLLERLGPEGAARFAVSSAGVRGHVDEPITPLAVECLVSRGADAEGFRGRQVEVATVEAADLVLTMTRAHRVDVATADPTAPARTFTLLEFARLVAAVDPDLPLPDERVAGVAGDPVARVAGDPVARLAALVAAARSLRGRVVPEAPGDDDLPDPYGQPPEEYAVAAETIDIVVRGIVDRLAPGSGPAAAHQ